MATTSLSSSWMAVSLPDIALASVNSGSPAPRNPQALSFQLQCLHQLSKQACAQPAGAFPQLHDLHQLPKQALGVWPNPWEKSLPFPPIICVLGFTSILGQHVRT